MGDDENHCTACKHGSVFGKRMFVAPYELGVCDCAMDWFRGGDGACWECHPACQTCHGPSDADCNKKCDTTTLTCGEPQCSEPMFESKTNGTCGCKEYYNFHEESGTCQIQNFSKLCTSNEYENNNSCSTCASICQSCKGPGAN
jgi:hypothetical protein